MSDTPAFAVTGNISLHPRGFGFLNFPGAEGPESAFIPPPDLNAFLLGDSVSASVKRAEDGRSSATDLSLLERKRRHLFGEVVERRGRLFLLTDREVANTDWPLEGAANPGEFWLCRIDGTRVVAQRQIEGDIALARLIARYDLQEEFTAEALKQAETIAKKTQKLGSRRDLRHLPTVTIDAPSTRDIDDAVSVIPAGIDGVLHLLVSIADPAEVIEEGSALDLEARSRGTSTYLTGRVLPMLPDQLSSDALSLHPGVDRHCLTAEMRIDAEGQVVAVDLYESLIRSTARLSYQEVADWLDFGDLTENLSKVEEILPWLRTASARLAVFRQRRGGMNLSGTELAEVTLDSDGAVAGTAPSRSTDAHMMIERFMVCANEAVARWLVERGLPGTFRIHPLPDEESVKILSECAFQFGYEAGFARQLSPGALAAFDAQIAKAAAEPAIRSVLRGILGRANYTVHHGLHLGLAAPLYLHFTSPLRRYADLSVHRLIKGYLQGDRHFEVSDPEVEALCQHLNERAAASAKAESMRRRMLLAAYMERHIGEEFDAHVTRVLPFGLVVQLDASLVEGLLPLESLPGGPWEVRQVSVDSPERRLTLGMPVRVKVVDTVPDLGRIEYSLVEGRPGPALNDRK
jgi:ribonuclease R